MRNTTLSLGCLVLTACIGNIGDPAGGVGVDGPGKTPTTTSDTFECDADAAAQTPTAIRRLAKVYLSNAIEELLSALDEPSRHALMSAIQTRIDLVPADVSDFYSSNDDKVTQDHVDAIFGLAMALATKISENVGYSSGLVSPCGAGSDASTLAQDACLGTFVEHYGRKAFRRPLEQSEVHDFVAFYQQAKGQGVDGLAALVARFVAHPSFYYRFDFDGDVVEGAEGEDAIFALTKWELLSKVTFLFWAAPPTDELYDRVAAADITQDEALADLVDDVLADPRAERGVLAFYREWLELEKTKRPATEGNTLAGQALVEAAGLEALPSTHREDMIQEVLDLAKHYTLTTDGTFGDILTSQISFARTPELATIYGVAPWDGSADHLVSLPAGERSGLLTRAALLASNAEYTRPIIKGKQIRTRVLCAPIAPPPPNLKIEPLVHPADKTTIEAVEDATGSETCQACHASLNPLGFLSEGYDPLGRVRAKELRFAEGTADVVAELAFDTRAVAGIFEGDTKELQNAVELGAHIAESGKADTCLVQSYFEFVTGRARDPQADGCDLVVLRDELVAEGGSLKAMLKASVMQQSFRRRMVK